MGEAERMLPSPPAAYPRPSPLVVLRWLCRIGVAFGIVCAALIGGFAPYSGDMGAVLQVSAILLLVAGACALFDRLLGRLQPLP